MIQSKAAVLMEAAEAAGASSEHREDRPHNLAADEHVEKVLQLSAAQRSIVQCPNSTFVQGRSGTGKTVVIVDRMRYAHQLLVCS